MKASLKQLVILLKARLDKNVSGTQERKVKVNESLSVTEAPGNTLKIPVHNQAIAMLRISIA